MPEKKHTPDINVEITQTFEDIDIRNHKIKELVADICARFNILRATVSIAIVDDTRMTELNTQFLEHNYTTDCLSFDLSDDDADSPKIFDLIVNAELATRQAELRNHPAEAELALYITHTMLHNLGFDDAEPQQAKKMHQKEDEILQQHGFGLIYDSKDNDAC